MPEPKDAAAIPLNDASTYRRKQLVRAVRIQEPVVLNDSMGALKARGAVDDWLIEDAYGRRYIVGKDDFYASFEPVVVVTKS